MRSLFYLNYFVLLLIAFCVKGTLAQDSLRQIVTESPKQPNWKIGISVSVGLANGRNLAGIWYKANFSSGTSLQLGRRVADNIWINTGASLDFFRYRSAPFVHSGSYFHHYGMGIGWWVDFEDNFERFTERNSRYVTIPLSVEYTSPKSIGWYVEVGASVGRYFYDEEINKRADTKELIPYYGDHNWTSKIRTPYNNGSLFMNLSGGFQLRKNQSIYQFGLRYDHILANFGGETKERGVHALRFEIGVQHEIKGDGIHRFVAKSYDDRLERKNYVYAELLGNIQFKHSINYERSLFIREKSKWNGRLGVAAFPGAQSDKWVSILILGGSYIAGRVHAMELGLNVANFNEPQYIGPSENEFMLIPTLGYRFEPKNGIFGRLSYTPQIFLEENSNGGRLFLSLVGLSLGAHF